MRRYLLLLLLWVPLLANAQVQSTPIQTITTSSGTLSATVAATCIGATPSAAAGVCGVIPNLYGAYGVTFEEIPNGSPGAVTINVYGCMRGSVAVAPTCDTVADSNTSTTQVNRGITFSKLYGVFVVLATMTGGTTPSVTINPLISTANNHQGSGSFTAAGDLSGTSSTQEVVGLLNHALPGLSTGFLNWTGSAWALSSAGAGTVTSVAQTVPSWLSVGGSPVTGSGTLAITAATGQTSHQVIGTCGAATTFAPCALVAGDMPTAIPIANVGSAGLSGTSPVTINSAGAIGCATCGVTGSPLSQFAATTSAQLAGVISDETGTSLLVYNTSPTLVTPLLGTPTSGVLTNTTGYLWNNNTAPTGNLSLAMGSDTSIFTTTTGVSQFFAWKNTTAALVGASQSSPINSLCGTEWHASASVEGCAALQFVPGTGTDAANAINFTHTGSATGVTTTNFPGPVAAGTSGSNPGVVVLPGNTAALTPTANTAGIIGPNSASFTATWYQLPVTPPSGTQSLVCGTPSSNVSACSFTTVTGGVSSVNTLTGAVVIEAATAGQMAVSGGNGAALTGAADMTYSTHTFATTTAGIFDWSAATGTNAFKLPAIIGGSILAGTSTANLSAPIVFQNTNSSNNNTSITMGVTAPGTSTGQTVLNVNGASTGGDLIDAGTGGAWASGVLSGQSLVFQLKATGALALGSSPPACAAGTGGGLCFTEGTNLTNTSGTAAIDANSTTHEIAVATNGSTSFGLLNRTQPGSIRSTGLVAAVSTATLCAASAGACNVAGTYHLHFALYQSGSACSANTTNGVSVQVTWTDANGTAHSAQTIPLTINGTAAFGTSGVMAWGATTVNAWGSGDLNVDTNGTVIQYATSFAQCTTGTATYALSATVSRLQ